MDLQLRVLDENVFIEAFKNCKSGEFASVTSEAFEIPFKELKPFDGFEKPVGNTGKQHPACCEHHSKLYADLTEWYAKFPNCCNFHKRLNDANWFNKEDYADVVRKVSDQECYTEQYIQNEIGSSDWEKKITDYFEVNTQSFGQLKRGFGVVGLDKYLDAVENYVRHSNVIPEEKRGVLIRSLLTIRNPIKSKPEKDTDFNVLIATYKKWLKMFPFEINYFANLKDHFARQLPILTGERKTNIHSGLVQVRVHSQVSLIEALIDMTKTLLEKIDPKQLVEQSVISDYNAHQFMLGSEVLRIETSKITQNFTSGELQYIKALKKWLQLHKKYFRDVAPLFKEKSLDAVVETKSPTKRIIEGHLETLDREKEWRYAFTCKQDYEMFVSMLVDFFEHKSVTHPVKSITLKRGCKSKLAKVLNPIHKDLGKDVLRTDSEFFKIVRTLNHFEMCTNDEIYSAITK